MKKYTAEELRSLPTIHSGHFGDQKIVDDEGEVWLERSHIGDYLDTVEPATSVKTNLVTVFYKDGRKEHYIAPSNDGLDYLRRKILKIVLQYEAA